MLYLLNGYLSHMYLLGYKWQPIDTIRVYKGQLPSHRNQPINLQNKSDDWFIYDRTVGVNRLTLD